MNSSRYIFLRHHCINNDSTLVSNECVEETDAAGIDLFNLNSLAAAKMLEKLSCRFYPCAVVAQNRVAQAYDNDLLHSLTVCSMFE